ncbi:hypothetical protein [Peribacillus sp. SCS-155]|uniref:hypothetical protein n=1 Tax=Peribacillus sedimenti TaxID=3115297 RepID=UPI003905AE82
MTAIEKCLTVSLSFCILLAAGCSKEEAEQKSEDATKQIEQASKEAAGNIKETAGKVSDQVKKETPGLAQNMKDTYKEGERKIKDNILLKGDKAQIKKDAYLALTPEAYDELYQLIELNDLKGVENIEKDKQIIKVKKDVKVEILERDVLRTKIKTSDNKEGYLPASILDPVN